MKKLLSIITLGALALALPTTSFAGKKKDASTPAPAATPAPPADTAKKPAETTPGATTKVMGMYIKVDAIDVAAKTFTHKKKDGTEVKFVLSDKTEIKNGTAPATLADIKVGDTVSGSRIEKSKTEYEVVKITKFGIAAPKVKKTEAAKTETAAPEEKKQ
jgi:hypothetical protein